MAGEIEIAAAVILDARARMLLVRKHETRLFQQPGGKIDVGETPERALCREIAEELAIALTPCALFRLGLFSAPAANEPGHVVNAHIFEVATSQHPLAAAEIAEIAWLDLDTPAALPLAPLTSTHIVPLARRLAARRRLAS